jgi:hypothetical protein
VHRKTLPAQGRPGSLGRNRRRPNVLGGSLFGIEICVTSSTNNDQLPPWANYGAHTVDLAAPGVSIYSTLRQDEYGYLSGGSMATPQVAGAAALILSVEPSLSPEELKADILSNVDKLPWLSGRVITGGRLDVCRALPGCPRQTTPPPPSPPPVAEPQTGVLAPVGEPLAQHRLSSAGSISRRGRSRPREVRKRPQAELRRSHGQL